MRDGEIRVALARELAARHANDPSTIIRHELGLCMGETRVDLAVLNGSLAGFEIKSPADTLQRLPKQVGVYGRVLDEATLVTTEKYADRATRVLPDWWGLEVVTPSTSGLQFESVRPVGRNPEVDPYSLAQLLWRDEALELLTEHGLHRGMAKATRFKLWQTLAEQIALETLRDSVRERIKARPAWPGGQ